MKKLLLLTAIAVFGFNLADAQDVKFGAKAGINLSKISVNQSDGFEFRSKPSFHLGGFVELVISEKFSFQPELIYSSQGTKSELVETFDSGIDFEQYEYKSDITFEYLNIPLMAKFYAVKGLSLEVGPQIGFLLSAKDDYEEIETFSNGEDTVVDSFSGSDDIKEFVKNTDFGLNFGLGYQLDNGLLFGARYNVGLSNISDDNEDAEEEDEFRISNRVFQVSVGYRF